MTLTNHRSDEEASNPIEGRSSFGVTSGKGGKAVSSGKGSAGKGRKGVRGEKRFVLPRSSHTAALPPTVLNALPHDDARQQQAMCERSLRRYRAAIAAAGSVLTPPGDLTGSVEDERADSTTSTSLADRLATMSRKSMTELLEQQGRGLAASLASNTGKFPPPSGVASSFGAEPHSRSPEENLRRTQQSPLSHRNRCIAQHLAADSYLRQQGVLTEEAVLEAHRLLMAGGLCAENGRFRSGVARCGRFYFPRPDKVRGEVRKWVAALAKLLDRDEVSIYAKASWVLVEFLAIHPFQDGNGRLARLICDWVLCVGAAGFLWRSGGSDVVRGDHDVRRAGLEKLLPFGIAAQLCASDAQRQRYISAVREADLALFHEVVTIIAEDEDHSSTIIAEEAAPVDEKILQLPTTAFAPALTALIVRNVHQAWMLFDKLQGERERGDVDSTKTSVRRDLREQLKAEEQCIICFENGPDMMALCCGAIYHFDCLRRWLVGSGRADHDAAKTCVNCRAEIKIKPDERANESTEGMFDEDEDITAIDEEIDDGTTTEALGFLHECGHPVLWGDFLRLLDEGPPSRRDIERLTGFSFSRSLFLRAISPEGRAHARWHRAAAGGHEEEDTTTSSDEEEGICVHCSSNARAQSCTMECCARCCPVKLAEYLVTRDRADHHVTKKSHRFSQTFRNKRDHMYHHNVSYTGRMRCITQKHVAQVTKSGEFLWESWGVYVDRTPGPQVQSAILSAGRGHFLRASFSGTEKGRRKMGGSKMKFVQRS